MLVKNEIPCKYCGEYFSPKTYKHFFCYRKCYIKHYRGQSKSSKYPLCICSNCGKKILLDFYPKLALKKWADFKCPYCSEGREYSDYYIIQALKKDDK